MALASPLLLALRCEDKELKVKTIFVVDCAPKEPGD